jgi:enamine deaminase RidA (YjgF/YER057c/UK114 family)
MAKLTFTNPPGAPVPGSRYSQAALVEGSGRRLVISGQIGVTPSGEILADPVAQIRQALDNLAAILDAHGMTARNIVKVVVLLTDRALIKDWRATREAAFGDHAPASTLMIVAGLADPRFVVEVEAEAVD